MTSCQACGTVLIGRDRFCRNCGASVAASVGDLVDTHRFNPAASLSATAPPGSQEPTNPFYAPPPAAYPGAPASAPAYQTGAIGKKLFQRKLTWLAMFLLLFFSITVGLIGIRSAFRPRWAAQAGMPSQDDQDEQAEMTRRLFEEGVQNALGFRQGPFLEAEFSDVRGIFVNNLMSDDSPAALANIQAGDLLMELNGQAVRNDGELAQVLNSLKAGMEVPVKLYRDGATITSSIKVADRSFPPLQPKIEQKDQGFLGVKDSGRRCCVPGTRRWGVEVQEIFDNSSADLFGLKAGDVIAEFNGHAIRTPNEFNRLIRAVKPRSKVTLKFYRGSTEQVVDLIMGHRW